jgi:hypothetical protein
MKNIPTPTKSPACKFVKMSLLTLENELSTGLRPSSWIKYIKNIKSRRFGSWFFFRLQVMGGETPTQMGPLDRAYLNHWTTSASKTIAI